MFGQLRFVLTLNYLIAWTHMAAELNEYNYDKLLDLTARYNRRLLSDKLSRLPFLDNATGIAQRPCLLYRNSYEREEGNFRIISKKFLRTNRSGPPLPSA